MKCPTRMSQNKLTILRLIAFTTLKRAILTDITSWVVEKSKISTKLVVPPKKFRQVKTPARLFSELKTRT